MADGVPRVICVPSRRGHERLKLGRADLADKLLARALIGSLVRPPAMQPGAMTEAAIGHLVVDDLDDRLGSDRRPVGRPFGCPPARTARSLSGKPGAAGGRGEARQQNRPVGRGDPGGEADMIELARVVVKPEQQRRDPDAVGGHTIPAHHTVGSAQLLDLRHRAFAPTIGQIEALCDDAIKRGAGTGQPCCSTERVTAARRQQELWPAFHRMESFEKSSARGQRLLLHVAAFL